MARLDHRLTGRRRMGMTSEPIACGRGRLTDRDKFELARFEEWLQRSGPPAPRHASVEDRQAWWNGLTEDQRQFRKYALNDPDWRAWLGLPPLTE